MRTDYSAPRVTFRSTHPVSVRWQNEPDEEKQVDYSHLDIIAEVERIIDRRLIRHTRTSGKYHCACPFPDCTSKNDAFTVWDRPVLEERGDGRREVHFWCSRCGRMGSLISLIRQYHEITTGEQISWADAARALRIDPKTWRAIDESSEASQGEQRRATAAERRRQQAEQQHKADLAELATLDALYRRARVWLATGQIAMKDGRQIRLDQVRAYLLERGLTLDQAAQLGLAYVPTVQEVPEFANLVARAWRGRLLFPLTGPQRVTGYTGRTLWRWTPGMTTEQHKQLLDTWNENHPDRRIARYYKTRLPAYYGYEDACQASILVIVEGEFDAASVRLALSDLPDLAVCAFGKNFLARLVPVNVLHVVLALDMDQAGQEAIGRLVEELQARGVTVSVAAPPVGKDWNDCHLLAGLEVIRAEILRTCNVLSADMPESEQASLERPSEPPGYDNGDICLLCGKKVGATEDAFYVCEDRASVFYGDMFCLSCWIRQNCQKRLEQDNAESPPASVVGDPEERSRQERAAFFALVHQVFEAWPEPYTILEEEQEKRDASVCKDSKKDEQFTEVSHRCSRHHRPLRYGDELGGRYCDHLDCQGRYRLMRYGAAHGYPALFGIIDPRDYLPDTSKAPLYYTDSGLPIYAARPAISQQLIHAGVDAWHAYTTERPYQDIDKAIRVLEKASDFETSRQVERSSRCM